MSDIAPAGSTNDGRTAPHSLPLEPALVEASHDPAQHRAAAERRRRAGDELAALAHLVAAHTLDTPFQTPAGRAVDELCQVATGYFMLGDHASATCWYELVLSLNPNAASALQNLAAIHAEAGRTAQAEQARQRAYALQRVFVEPVRRPVRQLLILYAGRSAGNVALETLLSGATSTRIKYVIDYATQAEDAQLPPFDLVFNAIGEPDVAATLAERVEHFALRCGRPVLNPPHAIGRTQRHRLAMLLAGIEDVVVPGCARLESPLADRVALAAALDRDGVTLPALLRPAATHGGQGLELSVSVDAILGRLQDVGGVHYATSYVDSRCSDGHYRKYRMVYVDRVALPYHLAISPRWMVHYFSSEMARNGWKIEEEARFLRDPRSALGDRALAAIAAIGRRIDLDFAGIDFTVLPDGRLLVFEANATMLVHRERDSGALAHKNAYVQRIADAFDRLLERRTPG
jgi:hypothetical protein